MATTASLSPAIHAHRAMHVTLWVAQSVLAAVFAIAGGLKLSMTADDFAKLGLTSLPIPLVRFIGVAELAGAAGLILPALTGIRPRLTPLAAIGLLTIMVLASCFH